MEFKKLHFHTVTYPTLNQDTHINLASSVIIILRELFKW